MATDERAVALEYLDASNEQLQTLCVSHAGTFVAVERRARALQTHLEQLLQDCTAVRRSVEDALLDDNALAELSERHRVRRRTLLQHSSLLELLELPNIMDACVRSALYEEALQVAAFANTLARRHSEQDTVVQQVIQQIRSRQSDLRRHLLHRLRVSVTMPECLEVGM
jgi:conserved oligomeric Golgi complex subunit 8